MEQKECLFCHKPIIRKVRSNLQWSIQKTHGMCRPAYDKLENAKLKREPRRFFIQKGKVLTRPC